MTFKPNKIKHYPTQIIFLQRVLEPLMQTTRKQCVDLMQGGGEYFFTILPSGHSSPKHISFNITNSYPSFY